MCQYLFAIVDKYGNVSSQFILDYDTRERTYFDCESYSELMDVKSKNVSTICEYSEDNDGVTISFDNVNGIFYNYVDIGNGWYTRVRENQFFWECGTINVPNELEWDAYHNCTLPYYDTFMVPGVKIILGINDGVAFENIDIEISGIEIKEIGNIPLMPREAINVGMPQKDSRNNDVQFNYDYYNVEYNQNNIENGYFYIDFKFGLYDRETWSLTAVRKIIYHISNVHIKEIWGLCGIQKIKDKLPNTYDSEEVVYDIYGCKVSHLLPGNVYISNGRKFIK